MNRRSYKTALIRAGSLLATLAGGWVVMQLVPPRGAVSGRNPFRAPIPGQPLVIAHAGGLGLHPENTLEAFAASVALGCDLLEMDARLTKDGVLVTHHDASVQRTSNGTGAVRDHMLAELKSLNFGHRFRDGTGAQPYRDRPARVATVQELFERFGEVPMVIELKDRDETGRQAASALATLIANHGMTNRVLVASFDDTTLDAFRRASGGRVATSTAKDQTRRFIVLRLLGLDRLWPGGAVAAQVPAQARESAGFDLTRPGFVRALHARNMAVHYWTVNDPDEMRRLIQLGADGLITDYPDRLKAILAENSR